MAKRSGMGVAMALSLAAAAGVASAQEAHYDPNQLIIEFIGPPLVEVFAVDELAQEEEFRGRYAGIVAGEPENLFAGAEVTCEFEGLAAPGRVFSCGFTTVEDVAGRCLFTAETGDVAIAEWTCRTGARMTSDARCEGKAEWVEGTGKFAGITGAARIHSDLFLQPGKGFAKWKGTWRIDSVALLGD